MTVDQSSHENDYNSESSQIRGVPITIPFVKKIDRTRVVYTVQKPLPIPPGLNNIKNSVPIRSNNDTGNSEQDDGSQGNSANDRNNKKQLNENRNDNDNNSLQLNIQRDLIPVHKNQSTSSENNASKPSPSSRNKAEPIDKSKWFAQALRRNPELVEMVERIRPISRQNSLSRPLLPIPTSSQPTSAFHARRFSTSPAPSGGGFGSPNSPLSASPEPYASNNIFGNANTSSPNSTSVHNLPGISIPNHHQHLASQSMSSGSPAPSSPIPGLNGSPVPGTPAGNNQKDASAFDRTISSFSADILETSSRSSKISERERRMRRCGRTEVKDVVSPEAILQLVYQHLDIRGYTQTREALEKETGVKWNGITDQKQGSTNLRHLLQMGISDEDNLFHNPETIFKDDLHEDSEVLTGSIYAHVAAGDEDDEDVLRSIWDEGPDAQEENVKYGEGDNEKRLVAGTLNKLVEKLTDSTAPEGKYMDTFLVTYRSFTTPDILLMKLMERWNVPETPEWEAQKDQIRLRVGNVIRHWLESYIFDWNQNMLRILNRFIEDQLFKDSSFKNLGKLMKKSLEKKLAGKDRDAEFVFRPLPPDPIVPKGIFTSKLDIFDIDELEIARQLTIVEHDLFREIQPSELLNQAWNKPKIRHRSPHVYQMIQRFNKVSEWVSTQIVTPRYIRERKARMLKFIKIAEHALQLNNFNTLLAIGSGIQNAAVHRLRHTKEAVGQKTMDAYTKMMSIMKQDGAYREYRNRLYNIEPPCVPYLGVYLTDLTFVEDGNKDYITTSTGRKLINWAKRTMVFARIMDIQQYQDTRYHLQKVFQIQKLLDKSLEGNIADEDELFSMSLEREPRGADRSEIL
eukprot:gb/GECH01009990.1/.p1 GENE.gb/GECH01009990.1/~~gb/GECH01009990.1/.p1  ORF type:complete len:854 (+),score=250.42 gb/GECH01009990.1/:1-2562(+)